MAYIHGYDSVEQRRLLDQAIFLEPYLAPNRDLLGCRRVLEMGCGVGAQSKMLLARYPTLKLLSVDVSKSQLEAASKNLEAEIALGRVELLHLDLAAPEDTYAKIREAECDGLYICWVLEHVADPISLLRKSVSLLRAETTALKIQVFEVANFLFFLGPNYPYFEKYWQAFNSHQIRLGGDPYVGMKLKDLLRQVGASDLEGGLHLCLFDQGQKFEGIEFLKYMKRTVLSGAPALLADGIIDTELFERATMDLDQAIKEGPTFSMGWASARAKLANGPLNEG